MALLMTMEKHSDRELLELAAKAAGYDVFGSEHPNDGINILIGERVLTWQPLTDDGDALRLSVKLRLDVDHNQEYACVYGDLVAVEIENGNNPYAATRRAIVRAAAEIGRRMQDEQSTAARG